MTQDKTTQPRSAAQARRDREAEALRANLRKRKEQQRAREAPARGDPQTPGKDAPGEAT